MKIVLDGGGQYGPVRANGHVALFQVPIGRRVELLLIDGAPAAVTGIPCDGDGKDIAISMPGLLGWRPAMYTPDGVLL